MLDFVNVTCYTVERLCDMSVVVSSIINMVQETITLDEAGCFNIRLILSELIVNGFKHGRAGSGRPVKVIMSIEKDLRYINFIIDDGGQGFTYRDPSEDMSWTKAESGRGLAIVHALSSECKLSNKTGWVTVKVAV